MPQSLGSVAVEIVADTSKFEKSLQTGLKNAESTVTKSGDNLGTDFGSSLGKAAESGLKKQAPKIATPLTQQTEKSVKSLAANVAKSFTGIGSTIGKTLGSAAKTVGKQLAPITAAAQKAFAPLVKTATTVRDKVAAAFSAVGAKVGTALSKVGGVASKMFAPIGNVAKKAAAGISGAFGNIRAGASTVFSKIGGVASTAFGKLGGLAKTAMGKVGTVLGKAGGIAKTAFSKIGTFAASGFSKIGGALSSVMSKAWSAAMTAAKVGAAGVVAATSAVLVKGFQRLTGIENAEAALKGLGYTAKQAAGIINGPVLKAVSGTAFALQDAAAAAQGALGAGIENGAPLAKYLTLVGDAASQAQVDFGAMAQIMNKVQGAGKLTGDTLQQMADNSLQVMPMLVEALGKPQAEIQKMVSQGKISAEQFQEILQKNIGGAAQKAGDTTIGAFKNMGAAAGRLGAHFEAGIFPYFKKTFAGITALLNSLGPTVEKLGSNLGKYLKPAMEAFTNFTKSFKVGDLSNITSLFSPIMTVVKAAIPVLSTFGGVFKDLISDQMASFGKALAKINVEPFIDAFTAIGTAMTSVMLSLGKINLGPIIGQLVTAFASLLNVVPAIMPPIMQLVSVLTGALGKILPVVAKLVVVLAKALSGILAQALPPLLNLITDLVGLVGDALAKIIPPLIPIITTLAGALGKILGSSFQVIATVITSIVTSVLPPLVSLFEAIMPLIQQLITSLLPPMAELFAALAPILGLILPPLVKLVTLVLPLLTKLISALVPILNVVIAAFGVFTGVVAKVVTAFSDIITGTKGFKQAFADAFRGIGKVFQPLINAAKHLWDFLFGHSIFPDIVTAMGQFVTNVGKTLNKVVAKIMAPFKKAGTWVATTWKKSWSKVSGIISGAVDKGGTNVGKILGSVKDKFTGAKTWVTGHWSKAWSAVSGIISGAVSKGRDKVGTILGSGGLRSKFSNARKWVGSTWKSGWSKVSGWISGAVAKGRDAAGTALGRTGLHAKFNSVKSWVKGAWKTSWDKISDTIAHPIRTAKSTIASLLGNKGVQKIMRSFIATSKTIMGGLKKVFEDPVNWVINHVLNPLIKAVNKIGGAVGLGGKNKQLITPIPALATGGVFRKDRYTPGRDIGVAALSGYETVLRPEFTRAVGEPWVNQANAAARMGGVGGAKRFMAEQSYGAFASGGIAGRRLPPNSDGDYDPRFDPHWLGGFASGGIARPINAAITNGLHDILTGFPAVDASASVGHPVVAGQAGKVTRSQDLRGNEPRNATQNGFYSYGRVIEIAHRLGQKTLYAHLSERMAKVGQDVKAGQQIGLSGNTGHSTGPHLHFGSRGLPPGSYWSSAFGKIINAVSGAVNSLGGLLDPVKTIKDAVGKRITEFSGKFGDSPWARTVIGVPKLLMDKAIDWGKEKIGSMVSFGGGDEPAGSGVQRWKPTITAALKANNLPTTDAYVNAWLRQVQTESGGNPNAVQHGYTDVNTLSGNLARGLLQVIPPTFAAYKFPGHGNIMAGLDNALAAIHYGKSRYGASGMLGVIGHGHGYDNGGWLPKGLSVAVNNTGRNENKAVFTEEQWQTLQAVAQGRDRGQSQDPIQIHLHGVIDSASAAREIEALLIKRGRSVSGVTLPARSRPVVRQS